jgi:hypothetical protein
MISRQCLEDEFFVDSENEFGLPAARGPQNRGDRPASVIAGSKDGLTIHPPFLRLKLFCRGSGLTVFEEAN